MNLNVIKRLKLAVTSFGKSSKEPTRHPARFTDETTPIRRVGYSKLTVWCAMHLLIPGLLLLFVVLGWIQMSVGIYQRAKTKLKKRRKNA